MRKSSETKDKTTGPDMTVESSTTAQETEMAAENSEQPLIEEIIHLHGPSVRLTDAPTDMAAHVSAGLLANVWSDCDVLAEIERVHAQPVDEVIFESALRAVPRPDQDLHEPEDIVLDLDVEGEDLLFDYDHGEGTENNPPVVLARFEKSGGADPVELEDVYAPALEDALVLKPR